MTMDAFELKLPKTWTAGVVFASPHSGAEYPAELVRKSVLSRAEIRSSEDAFVDRLFSMAPELGVPLLAARLPRAYVDLNRSPDELDPALILGVASQGGNPRVSSGLGVIPRVVANGRQIYRGKITREDAAQRLDEVWYPYHDCLAGLMGDCLAQFGQAILIDCHSMPHEAIDAIATGNSKPDIVLGDRYGASADGVIVEVIEAAFAEVGLSVTRNAPFAGAYTAQAYGRPSRGQHVVQIEIDRSLYMNEQTIRPRPDFNVMVEAIGHVVARIVENGRGRMPMAAE